MDWGSLIAIVLGLGGLLVGQFIEGGTLSSLFQPAAFVIVVVGTLGAVMLQTGLANFFAGIKKIRQIFIKEEDTKMAIARDVAIWSATARRDGFLSLEPFMNRGKDPFVQQGLRMIIDGIDPHIMRELLEQEIAAYESKERAVIRVWEAAGGYSPTIGIIGAVLGLIHVMEHLSDPSRLGAGIAIAFVATIYGVGLANLVFIPIGARLREFLRKDVQRKEMLADAFYAIAMSENSRAIEERMLIYRKS